MTTAEELVMEGYEPHDLSQTLTRIHAEYNEIPGLSLTRAQARRLWNLPEELCEAALSSLVESGFLVCKRNGTFLRPSPAGSY
jgi:hypothetical protein